MPASVSLSRGLLARVQLAPGSSSPHSPPLSSRCAKFRFLPLSDESIHERLRFIAEREGVAITDEICRALTETSGGDMRKAITYFQNAVQLNGADDLSADVIYDVAGVVPPRALEPFWKVNKILCRDGVGWVLSGW
jgi:DNA polymerase III delta prime subunit